MKTVYQCDYCEKIFTEIDGLGGALAHEKSCEENPYFKACATCKHFDWHVGSDVDYCSLEDDILLGAKSHGFYEYRGNCPKWSTDDIKLLRKMKLNKLKK